MTILQVSLDDLNQHLSLMEAESASWLSVPELVKTGDVQREITAVQVVAALLCLTLSSFSCDCELIF